MSEIRVNDLTFCYEGSYENVFEHASFCIDSDWKCGLIGRNGRGKTTFLRLLMGGLSYEGSISSELLFDYFPFVLSAEAARKDTADVLEEMDAEYELWRVLREMELLRMEPELLYRSFGSLSKGEQSRVMLAVLFAKERHFLLIDEPTNHLDVEGREIVQEYLKRKKSFLLVSHDRKFLDACIDHVLVINRNSISVERGNFSGWWENKERRDAFERAENERLHREIRQLQAAARQSREWAERVEATKIGYDPRKNTTRNIDSRAYIGEKSRRMQQRRKNLERRQEKAIADKEQLLKDVEQTEELRLMPLAFHKRVLVEAKHLGIAYGDRQVFSDLSFVVEAGDRVVLQGRNGCGKSSILKAILGEKAGDRKVQGELLVASGLTVSYVSQDTSRLRGSLWDYAGELGVRTETFLALLRKLDFSRTQFEKPMEDFSEGQKKKVLLAGSLCQPAHLYLWDEPLNYIDIFSRMQLEQVICRCRPTMVLVEHDRAFGEKVGTKQLRL